MTNPVDVIPAPIGPIHFNKARAILTRDPEAQGGQHSAVSSQFIVYTDTLNQTNAIIEHWTEIMQAAANKANEILGNVT